MTFYEKTHQCFKVALDWDYEFKNWPAVELCRKHFGDTDMYQPLQERPWFTMPSGEIWIRFDCLDSIPATFFALQQKTEVL